jgi:hypothetical protein
MMYTPPVRTQLGFRYRNADLKVVWTTSQPQTLEEALAYFERVAGWGLHPVYLEMRGAGQSEWTMIKKQFVNGEIIDV